MEKLFGHNMQVMVISETGIMIMMPLKTILTSMVNLTMI